MQMIEVNEDDKRGILTLKVFGKLTKQDLDDLVPKLKGYISRTEDPHLLMILDGFKGWKDAAAVWKDLQIDAAYIGYFDRIAVVGNKKWQEWGTKLMNPITKEELRFFSTEEANDAWSWMKKDHN